MARLWDTFMFRDELDMLQLRLEECEGHPNVYRHVLVEARVDHQGHPKPLVYADNRERFAAWSDKIIHVVVDELPESDDPWVREHAQRQHAWEGLGDADPDDMLLLADCDEIPNRRALEAWPNEVTCLLMSCYLYAVDWLWPMPMKTSALLHVGQAGHLADARIGAQRNAPTLEAAGWHMTWLGGPDAQLAKADSHCHIEFDEAIRADPWGFYQSGEHPWKIWYPGTLTPVDVDDSWPRMIRERRCPPSWFRPRP